MPAVSEKQRRLAGMALAITRGEEVDDRTGQAHEMARSMSIKELEKMASKPISKG